MIEDPSDINNINSNLIRKIGDSVENKIMWAIRSGSENSIQSKVWDSGLMLPPVSFISGLIHRTIFIKLCMLGITVDEI